MLKRSILIGVVITTMLLAACTNKPTTTETNTITGTTQTTTTPTQTTTTAATSAVTTTAVTTSTATPEPQYGGVFTYLFNSSQTSPVSFDPIDYTWTINQYNGYVQEQLLTGNLDTVPRGTFSFQTRIGIPDDSITGQLAESWEVIGSTQLAFHLRHGINFPAKEGVMSSRELVAADVAYSLNRLITSPKVSSSTFNWIDSIIATDKYTVSVKTNRFSPDWSYLLGWGYASVIYPQELVKAGITDWKNMVGTGPYKLTDYVFQSMLTYTKNDEYWGKTTINGQEYKLPFIGKIQLPIIVDTQTKVAALRTGKVDLWDAVAWNDAQSLDKQNLGIKTIEAAPSISRAVMYNLYDKKKPYQDVNVRRALSIGFNYQGFLDTMYNGAGLLLNTPYQAAWGNSTYTSINDMPADVKELFTYNPEKAKQMLADAGYPNGFEAEIVCTPSGTDMYTVVKTYWDKIGVKTTIKTIEYTTYLATYYTNKINWDTIYVAPTSNNAIGAIGSWITTKAPYNTGLYSDSYIDETYQKIISPDTSDQERLKLCKEVGNYYISQMPILPLPMGYNYICYWPWLNNYFGEIQVGSYSSAPVHARIWIDQKLKKKMGY